MKHKSIQISTGKTLEVYDDIFSFTERNVMIQVIAQSYYKVNGSDGGMVNARSDSVPQIYSSWTEQDLINTGFLNFSGFKTLDQKHNIFSKKIKQIRVNLSPPSERNYVHNDQAGLTVVYYPNLEWRIEWGGHTMFLTEPLDDIEYTCVNNPGRVVVFDGTIPHMVLTPTMLAPVHRYSFAIQFSNIEKE